MNTKLFWNTYLSDTGRFKFIAGLGLIVAIVLSLIGKSVIMVIPFCIGCILTDPFSYYWIVYRPRQRDEEIVKHLMTTINYERMINERNEVCKHEPLLEIDGKPIHGSKCCRFCGLNETYWNVT
jgi:hypothetical protein